MHGLIFLALLAWAGPAAAGDLPELPASGGGWASVSDGLAVLAMVLIGVATRLVWVLSEPLARYLKARAEALSEDATDRRVTRTDAALLTSLEAGRTPDEAAADVARQLPRTLARAGTAPADLVAKAAVLQAADNRMLRG